MPLRWSKSSRSSGATDSNMELQTTCKDWPGEVSYNTESRRMQVRFTRLSGETLAEMKKVKHAFEFDTVPMQVFRSFPTGKTAESYYLLKVVGRYTMRPIPYDRDFKNQSFE